MPHIHGKNVLLSTGIATASMALTGAVILSSNRPAAAVAPPSHSVAAVVATPSPTARVTGEGRTAPIPDGEGGTRWMFFVAWIGDRNGSTANGMSEVASTAGPVRTWTDVQGLVDGVLAANPGVTNVTIRDYQLLRIEG